MALWASVTNVPALPSAFWTVMSDAGSPAAAAACLIIGASNSTYRVELVVSGRVAAILPLPQLASDFSAAIAEKSFVNDVAEMLGVAVLLGVEVLVVELDDELPHPATTAPTATASPTAYIQWNFFICNFLSSFAFNSDGSLVSRKLRSPFVRSQIDQPLSTRINRAPISAPGPARRSSRAAATRPGAHPWRTGHEAFARARSEARAAEGSAVWSTKRDPSDRTSASAPATEARSSREDSSTCTGEPKGSAATACRTGSSRSSPSIAISPPRTTAEGLKSSASVETACASTWAPRSIRPGSSGEISWALATRCRRSIRLPDSTPSLRIRPSPPTYISRQPRCPHQHRSP